MKHERRIENPKQTRKATSADDARRNGPEQRELERHLEEAIELATD